MSSSMSVISPLGFDCFQHMCKEYFPLDISPNKCGRYIKLNYLRSHQRTFLDLSEHDNDLLTCKNSSYFCSVHTPAHILFETLGPQNLQAFWLDIKHSLNQRYFLPLGSLVLIIPGVWDILFY